MDKQTIIKLIISIVALILVIVRQLVPDIQGDSLTVGLLIVSILPWAPAFVESLKAPGGWEIKLKELDSKVETVIDASSEKSQEPSEFVTAQRAELSNEEWKVLDALTKSDVPLRSVYGISQGTQLNSSEVQTHLDALSSKGLAAKVEGKKGLRWGITPDGRRELDKSRKTRDSSTVKKH